MNNLYKLILYLFTCLARLKGAKIESSSYLVPPFDILLNNFKNITIRSNVLIGKNSWLDTLNKGKIYIGENTIIGRNLTLLSNNSITLGKNCLLSYGVSIIDHDHVLNSLENSPINSGISKGKEIIIGDNCFIGAHSFILKGVKLGKHVVVGANTVVTKNIPNFSVVAGNPAKIIKNLKNQ